MNMRSHHRAQFLTRTGPATPTTEVIEIRGQRRAEPTGGAVTIRG